MEYKIRKSSLQCARCEREFALGEGYVSVVAIEEEEPARSDFCEACFAPPAPERVASTAYWRARRSEAPDKKRAVDFPTLRELFFKMADSPGDEYRNIRYLLGLVLIRKRLIRLKEFVTEEGRDFLVVTAKQRPDPLRIEAPALHPSEFGELKQKLNWLLDLDFDQDAEATLPAAQAEETQPGDAIDGSSTE